MKYIIQCFILVFAFGLQTNAQTTSESPYFFVKSKGGDEQMPLKNTDVNVDIVGTIADVTVQQLYTNEGQSAINAVYVFPASTNAAVYSMTMTIGDRTIKAKIKEKKEARQMYETAKSEGKRATLLEQHRPNVFQMNVSNIMPGDAIIVEMKYTELLVPEKGEYSFVYPKVVGPRYVEKAGTAPFNNNAYLNEGEHSTANFDINVNINAGMPIQDVCVKTHEVQTHFPHISKAEVTLADDTNTPKDYILNYVLAGKQIDSGLLLFEGKEENFFLLTVQPPAIIAEAIIPSREYVFIVDVSGSMHGFPLNTSKKLLRNLISNLKPTDKFNVMLFSGGSHVLNDTSIPATLENIDKAIKRIDNYSGGGSTNMLSAINKAMALPKADDLSRAFVIVTDGYVSVEREVFDVIKSNLNKANFYAFGIGSGVNRFIIEGIAHVGQSEPFIVTGPENADEAAEKMRQYIASPVLTNVGFDAQGFDVYDVEPLTIPDVLGERPVLVFGKYRGAVQGEITVKGFTGQNEYVQHVDVASYSPSKSNGALKYLWARKKLQLLDDYSQLTYDKKYEAGIVEIGLKYNLLTRFTSFIAIDNVVTKGNAKDVKQPLPLPENVSNSAVGFDAPTVMKLKKSKTKSAYFVMTNIEGEMSSIVKAKIDQKLKKFKFNKGSKSIEIKIKIDAQGYVVGLEMLKGKLDKKQWVKLKYLLGSIQFDEDTSSRQIQLTFS